MLFPSNVWLDKGGASGSEDDAEDEALESLVALATAGGGEEEEKEYWRDNLTANGKSRRQRTIPREALLNPEDSAWNKLYNSKNDQAMITVTGFDYEVFQWLLKLFAPFYYRFTPWTKQGSPDGSSYRRLGSNLRGGRKRIIQAHSCLGLVLAWYRFRGPEYILQGWFGFTGTHANVWLKFGRRMLFKALMEVELAKPQWPDDANIETLKEIII